MELVTLKIEQQKQSALKKREKTSGDKMTLKDLWGKTAWGGVKMVRQWDGLMLASSLGHS